MAAVHRKEISRLFYSKNRGRRRWQWSKGGEEAKRKKHRGEVRSRSDGRGDSECGGIRRRREALKRGVPRRVLARSERGKLQLPKCIICSDLLSVRKLAW